MLLVTFLKMFFIICFITLIFFTIRQVFPDFYNQHYHTILISSCVAVVTSFILLYVSGKGEADNNEPLSPAASSALRAKRSARKSRSSAAVHVQAQHGPAHER